MSALVVGVLLWLLLKIYPFSYDRVKFRKFFGFCVIKHFFEPDKHKRDNLLTSWNNKPNILGNSF